MRVVYVQRYLTDIACVFNEFTSVGMPATWHPRTLVHVINTACLAAIFCAASQLTKFLDPGLLAECPSIRAVVCMDALPQDTCCCVAEGRVVVLAMKDLVNPYSHTHVGDGDDHDGGGGGINGGGGNNGHDNRGHHQDCSPDKILSGKSLISQVLGFEVEVAPPDCTCSSWTSAVSQPGHRQEEPSDSPERAQKPSSGKIRVRGDRKPSPNSNAKDDAFKPAANPDAKDDIFTLVFTSGSTGLPKGVILSRRVWLLDVNRTDYDLPNLIVSWLPSSWASDRLHVWGALMNGGSVAFGRGTAHLYDDFRIFRPTNFLSPPALWHALFRDYQEAVTKAIQRVVRAHSKTRSPGKDLEEDQESKGLDAAKEAAVAQVDRRSACS